MKKILVLYTLLFCLFTTNAQKKDTYLIGKTVVGKTTIVDVHVINKNTKIGTITNDKGEFEIPVKLGDSLLFSHLNLKNKLVIITSKIINNKALKVNLEEKTIVLKEMVLEKQRSIFYQDPEIITYQGPVVSAKTLNLPYANTKPKEDKAIIKIRSGGVVSLDNLINSINGNNRRLKQLKKMSEEDRQLEKIRKHFTDDFFITDLKIKREYINEFLNDCIDKNIINIFKNEDKIKLTKLLMEESKLYPKKIINEGLYLSKQ
ncbi:carboxypeptidase-like regulatory domain-containing protein [Polaribacter sp. Z022]|uniref:carboxypeptidase-like regulatory domain-containing protein n=1 Tax=Polaribacter sp. Z022 TaxID=2927125 RepID=UPI0020227448|nr:carboxypeptidase-like regulatory domain-containing protein [Polaribacter sp. Z022]MCL7754236.1 carboxypeptidase-like regulatory domain-containing protein [Polaribacter sp. Z022]